MGSDWSPDARVYVNAGVAERLSAAEPPVVLAPSGRLASEWMRHTEEGRAAIKGHTPMRCYVPASDGGQAFAGRQPAVVYVVNAEGFRWPEKYVVADGLDVWRALGSQIHHVTLP